jgi:N-acetylmuramoyl-L-alanine amidase
MAVAVLVTVGVAGACGPSTRAATSSSSRQVISRAPARSSLTATSTAVRSTSPVRTATPSSTPSSTTAAPAPTRPRPVIVLDPGHAPSIYAIDPRTGLNVSDYANEPEMRNVFAVAQIVKRRLRAAGYRVIMTKTRVTDRVSLARRAAIANRAHAALALSIHDQAGPNGGIGFGRGNSIVYYQSVGTYRATPSGRRIYFTNRRVAALSAKYGRIFRRQRARVEAHHVALQGNVGYDLGSRGLAAGNIWLVQLLARVPWIYNEAGGNSAGMSGLNRADRHRYAAGLVAAVEHCVPPPA